MILRLSVLQRVLESRAAWLAAGKKSYSHSAKHQLSRVIAD
jgi:hypothetical protein